MKLFSVVFALLIALSQGFSQNLYFPPTSTNTWDTVSLDAIGWCSDQLPPLYDFLEESNTKAFIVLKDGKIVIEKYFDDFTMDSLWYWASAGKTITAFMVGKAQEEGLLNISDTTSDYLGVGWTNLSSAQEEKITIKHQLSMTTGLDDGVPDVNCTNPSCLIYKADPETRWAYHNAPYTLLQDVVSAASGANFNAYLTPRLKTPTGMDGFFVSLGFNKVYFSKPRSMARFGLLMLNNGNWNGTQVMNDIGYLTDMITPSQPLNNSYGYLWWLNGQASFMLPGLQFVFQGSAFQNAPNDVYAAMGKNGQILNVSPQNNLVVVRMGNNPDNALVPTLYCDTIWQKLNPVMCSGLDLSDPPASELSPNLTIYPNPSNGRINLNGIDGKSTLLLYNTNGQVIWKKFIGDGTEQIQIPDRIKRGMYIISLKSGNQTKVQKIILN